eukprot:CAMPEP_0201485068 /NCGR_PEP_ID=MMETSP0151_2-20130828/9213_1 /ASSEMBLY_ACC=CAM_ASM_000257 /TAXON_ID=200890 /ORGANISM="Paramoeba atlantica, Strain 621/1 / CCAP 1560/9" /LENGTH=360 /DNA_ID=CAMNT_0047869039 /DNA_START=23 /DNA_END=1106 /DNA_ORIENTATION=-
MEGATNEKTIHLIFKTPSLDTGEHHMESVPLFLTLRDLKEQLSCSFPSNPAVERQKLIYGGKILQDQMTLSEVFAQRDISTPHVLHLVISALKQPPPSASQTQIPPNPPPPFQQPQQQQQQPPQQPQGGFYPGGQFQQAPFVGQQFGFGGQGAYFQGGFHPPPQGGFPNQFYFQQGPNMGGMGQNFNPGDNLIITIHNNDQFTDYLRGKMFLFSSNLRFLFSSFPRVPLQQLFSGFLYLLFFTTCIKQEDSNLFNFTLTFNEGTSHQQNLNNNNNNNNKTHQQKGNKFNKMDNNNLKEELWEAVEASFKKWPPLHDILFFPFFQHMTPQDPHILSNNQNPERVREKRERSVTDTNIQESE